MERAGAQKAMMMLARGLKNSGWDVVVATMYDKTSCIKNMENEYGILISDLQMKEPGSSHFTNSFRFISGILRLYNLVRHERVDVIQTFTHFSNIVGPFVALAAGVPVCVTSKRNVSTGLSLWARFLQRLVTNSKLVDFMTVVSEEVRESGISEDGLKAEKLITIYNGIDLKLLNKASIEADIQKIRESLGFSRKGFIVTTVARLHEQKGHKFLLRAVPKLISQCPNSRFVIVGDGPLKNELRDYVKQANIEDYVCFLGNRADISDLLRISDIFVLPSLWEGLPNALIEAMSLGVPVVATNLKGIREVIIDQNNGVLVEPGCPEALAKAILSLAHDIDMRQRLARHGYERISESFSFASTLKSYLKLYNYLLSSHDKNGKAIQ